jgi:hypothetical protein
VNRKSLAIATPVVSSKGAFAHGVLTALEEAGTVADAYAASSSSVIPASWAAIGQASKLGVDITIKNTNTHNPKLLPIVLVSVTCCKHRIQNPKSKIQNP